MCKKGDEVILLVPILAKFSYTGKFRWVEKGIDRCIAPIVKALNDAGIYTIASCCGHGKMPGNIVLFDERELVIASNYKEGRAIDRVFSSIVV